MTQNLPLTEEEQELMDIKIQYVSYPKLSKWIDLYFDKDNTYHLNTFSDGMLAAAQAYSLDITDPKQKNQAYHIGSMNKKKVKYWAQRYYELKGMTQEKGLDLIASLAAQKNATALKMFASIMGLYSERQNILVQNNIQNNTQVTTNTQIAPAEQEQFDRDFEAFIEQRYTKTPPALTSTGESS